VEIGTSFREFGVGDLWMRRSARRNVTRVAQPLGTGQIETLEVKIPGSDPPLRLSAQDKPAFTALPDDEAVTDETTVTWLRIETIRFRSAKWEFRHPITKNFFWAAIEDPAFRSRVDQEETAFRKGDSLYCRLRVRQWDGGEENLRTEYAIAEVLDHTTGDAGIQTVIGDIQPPSGRACGLPRLPRQSNSWAMSHTVHGYSATPAAIAGVTPRPRPLWGRAKL
jgi:hypothetical protein